MNVEQLYEVLKKAQEAQGFFFNNDKQRVFFLLQGLLTNKERYGYMCCPCRLAAEDRQQDQDIICPCAYRAPDVAEFGSCYCNLYVSRAWNDATIPHVEVPERRPLEKSFPL
jgi:ferredoxin-thioredoxin reductase catalytic chain